MRRWMAAPLLFAAAAALLILSSDAPRAIAQVKVDPPVEETFQTADGVQLRGLFHRSAKDPATAPVVILLYPPGKDKDMTKGDWEGLAQRLQAEGYHVFRFDWRGHGKNGTDIKDTKKFWENRYSAPWNDRFIVGAGKKPIKDNLQYAKDFKDANAAMKYAPVYLLDLAAVRAHLDSKNDAGDLNTSSIYLIGAEGAASIGMAWMTTEWHRPAFAPTPNQLGAFPRYEYVPQPLNGGVNTPAGEDISGAIWLSASHPASYPDRTIKEWVAKFAPKLRDNNPILWMYADKDPKAKKEADFFFNEVLVGKGDAKLGLNPLNQKYLYEVKGANALSGVALLGNDAMLKTETNILEFLKAIQRERAKITRKNRNFTAPWFIQLTGNGGFGFALP
jgi:pimeloyl-ACP methyl ester carboxylesterase